MANEFKKFLTSYFTDKLLIYHAPNVHEEVIAFAFWEEATRQAQELLPCGHPPGCGVLNDDAPTEVLECAWCGELRQAQEHERLTVEKTLAPLRNLLYRFEAFWQGDHSESGEGITEELDKVIRESYPKGERPTICGEVKPVIKEVQHGE